MEESCQRADGSGGWWCREGERRYKGGVTPCREGGSWGCLIAPCLRLVPSWAVPGVWARGEGVKVAGDMIYEGKGGVAKGGCQ